MTHFLWSLRFRVFAAHLVVIAVAGSASLVAAMAATPSILDVQVAHMRPMLQGAMPAGMGPGMMTGIAGFDSALAASFREAIVSALAVGGAVALLAGLVASVAVTGNIARPMRDLARAARRLSAGRYEERVASSGTDELDSVAKSFNEMASALEAGERRRIELIGDVAHELRTPIATLDGYLEGIVDGVVAPDESTWLLLQQETRRLKRLADDLAELSRAEAKQIRLDCAPVAPAAIVEPAVRRVAGDATALGLEVRMDVAAGLPPVQADVERAIQILTNLLNNAVRYTPPPGTIEVTATRRDHGVTIAVRDSGVGIGPEHLPHVFERFYRADKSRSRALGGSGIGLTIARAIAEAMDGRLTAESAGLGKGSTFTLWLPAAG